MFPATVTTIDDLLSGDADLSDFYAMLQGANFTGKLKEARNITVIVVNNAQIRVSMVARDLVATINGVFVESLKMVLNKVNRKII